MLEDGTVSCIGPVDNKTMTEAVIPSTVMHSGTEYAVEEIGYRAFNKCDVQSVTIGDGVLTIGEGAFQWCGALEALTIGKDVQTIGKNAFYNCVKIKSLIIPGSVQTIGYEAFRNCDGLKTVTIGKGVLTIGEHAFIHCGALRSVDLPDSVLEIEGGAFSHCGSLESVDIPDSLKTIGKGAFGWCGKLKTVAYGDGVEKIEDQAFIHCGSLESVAIPDSVGTIGKDAFRDCRALESVTIGKGVQAIGSGAFANCHVLGSIGVDPDNASCRSVDGVLFSDCMSVLECYPAGRPGAVYVIPAGVQTIEGHAFYDCDALESVSIPGGVQTIGENAFYDCDALQYVAIPGGVETIGDRAFALCGALRTVTVPGSVEKIEGYAFYCCAAVEDLTFEGGSPPELGSLCLKLGYTDGESHVFHRANCTVHSSIYNDVKKIPATATDSDTKFVYDYTAPPAVDLGAAGVSVVISGRYVYTGGVQHVSYAVSANGVPLPADELEIASDGSGTDAGTYRLVVKARGSSTAYVGQTAPAEWTIERKPLGDAMICVSGACIYSGAVQKVAFTVKDGGRTLSENTDYVVVSGGSGTAANDYTLRIEGRGNYCDEASAGWSIAQKPLADSMVMASGTYMYDGSEQFVAFAVENGGKALVEDDDYAVLSGRSGTAAGGYALKVEGRGNYCGTVSAEWSISAKPLESSMVSMSGGHTYSGAEQQAAFEVFDGSGRLAEGRDYAVVSGGSGTDAGGYTLGIEGRGNYCGTASAEWSIAPKALSHSMIRIIGDAPRCDGTVKHAEFRVCDGEAELERGRDFAVVAGDAGEDPGDYVLLIEGTGNYTGKAPAVWHIAPASAAPTELSDPAMAFIAVVGIIALAAMAFAAVRLRRR